MTKTTNFARVMMSFAVLCVATLVFAQNCTTPADNHNPQNTKPVKEGAENGGKCPVLGAAAEAQKPATAGASPYRDKEWWPNQLNLDVLHKHSPKGNPLGGDFNYAEEFKKLDLEAVKKDLKTFLFESPMIFLDLPARLGQFQSGQFIHFEIVGCPVFRRTVLGNNPEHFHHSIILEMDNRSGCRDFAFTYRSIATSVRVYPPVFFESC